MNKHHKTKLRHLKSGWEKLGLVTDKKKTIIISPVQSKNRARPIAVQLIGTSKTLQKLTAQTATCICIWTLSCSSEHLTVCQINCEANKRYLCRAFPKFNPVFSFTSVSCLKTFFQSWNNCTGFLYFSNPKIFLRCFDQWILNVVEDSERVFWLFLNMTDCKTVAFCKPESCGEYSNERSVQNKCRNGEESWGEMLTNMTVHFAYIKFVPNSLSNRKFPLVWFHQKDIDTVLLL